MVRLGIWFFLYCLRLLFWITVSNVSCFRSLVILVNAKCSWLGLFVGRFFVFLAVCLLSSYS